MSPIPLVRARHMKELLASVDRLPPERARSIRASIDDEHLRAIADASTVAWLPFDSNLALARALNTVLGPSDSHRFHRTHFSTVLQGPILGTLLQGALAVYGFDPAKWMRLLPPAWDLLFRHCGSWTITNGPSGRVEMLLQDLPPGCVADRVWPTTVASSIAATLDLARRDGHVDVVDVDGASRQARYELRWS